MQRFKNDVSEETKNAVNSQIKALKDFIVSKYNADYSTGITINSRWLKNVVNQFHLRPQGIVKTEEHFFLIFLKNFLVNFEEHVNPSTGRPLSDKTRQKYQTTLSVLKEFETSSFFSKYYSDTLKHSEIDKVFHKRFNTFMSQVKNYSANTRGKYIAQIKTLCRLVEDKGYNISPDYKSRNGFPIPKDDPIDTYLNEDEILKIYKLKPSKPHLNNSRQWFIIGLWTGMRVSDLLSLKKENITADNIIIPSSIKTKSPVKVPIHDQVRYILKENDGNLPTPVSPQKFNSHIKEICKEAGITEQILGRLQNPKTKRKETAIYPKYKLISSHTCRRSFATNLDRKLSEKTIMAITGHKSVEAYRRYIKTSKEEYIEELKDFWDNQKTEQE